jgi:hypothetical protein
VAKQPEEPGWATRRHTKRRVHPWQVVRYRRRAASGANPSDRRAGLHRGQSAHRRPISSALEHRLTPCERSGNPGTAWSCATSSVSKGALFTIPTAALRHQRSGIGTVSKRNFRSIVHASPMTGRYTNLPMSSGSGPITIHRNGLRTNSGFAPVSATDGTTRGVWKRCTCGIGRAIQQRVD